MTVLGEIGFPDGAAVLDLDIAWIHGSEAAKYNTDPDIQVHACDEYTYILRGAGRGARDDLAAGLA